MEQPRAGGKPEQSSISLNHIDSLGNIAVDQYIGGNEKRGGQEDKKTEYWYDIYNDWHLLGGAALSQYIEAGNHPADIRELGTFIRSDEPIVHKKRWTLTYQTWSDEQILDTARWLCSILPAPSKIREKLLSQNILNRSSYLGLFLSARQIKLRFGSVSNFYQLLGKDRLNIRHHELTTDLAREYVKELHDERGRMPTEAELIDIAARDPSKYSYQVLHDRIPGGLSSVARELGYVVAKKDLDYLDWGVEFFAANGVTPTQTTMDIFSREQKSPSYSSTKRRWALPEFQQLVIQAYSEKSQETKDLTAAGKVPSAILESAHDIHSLITQFLRFDIARTLLPKAPEYVRIRASIADLSDQQFIRELQRYNRHITWDLIQDAAEKHGVFKNMWRDDYIKSLQIEEVVKTKLRKIRGELTEEELYMMEDAIDITVDFMVANQLRFLKAVTINFLRNRSLIPSRKKLNHLFHDQLYFSLIVNSRLRKALKELEDEQTEAERQIKHFEETNIMPEELFYRIALNDEDNNLATSKAAEFIRLRYQAKDRTGSIEDVRFFTVDTEGLTREEKKHRLGRFMLVNAILPNIPIEEKIIICVLQRSRSFWSEIKTKNPNLTTADIQHKARELGIIQYADGLREEHLDRLRSLYKKHRRSRLNKAYHQRKMTLNDSV